MASQWAIILAGVSRKTGLSTTRLIVGRRHVVNIVTLEDGSKYVVDVGFGGDGPIQPLPLLDGHVVQNISTQELRLVQSRIPPQTLQDETNKMWIYQYRNNPSVEWNSFYAFPSLEFFAPDFEIMNYFISHSPDSFQTYRLLVVKFLRTQDENADASIHAKIMLVNDQVKVNTGGRTSVIQTCRTEEERVQALEKYFGIKLNEEERLGINGRSTELGHSTGNDTST
jgi:arylamine N-acetyltransferase